MSEEPERLAAEAAKMLGLSYRGAGEPIEPSGRPR